MTATRRIFLDTNIILDFLDDQRPHYDDARRLMTQLSADDWRIVISEDMLSTIFYIRKNPRQVLAFYQYVLQHWDVVPYGKPLMEEAVNRALEHDLDLEDMLQCLCAKQEECTLIVTEDKDFVDCGVEVLDYEGFLS